MAASGQPIAVVGAGPAGCIAATLLARGGARVVVLDDGRPSPDRMEMLPPAAVAALRQAGIDGVVDDPAVTVRCLGIAGSDGRPLQDFGAAPGGRAFAVHRPALDAALKGIALAAGVSLRKGRLVGVDASDGTMLVVRSAAGTGRVAAACVVDASGRASAAARRMGARSTALQKLTAGRLPDPADPGAWLSIEHGDAGWTYTIRGPGRRVDGWHVRADPAGTDGRPPMVDASARSISPSAGPGWIAIGDASAAFDPICCQGLAHAVGTALAATEIILARGTVTREDARAYDEACRATMEGTEAARLRVYAGMAAGRHARAEDRDRMTKGERECELEPC